MRSDAVKTGTQQAPHRSLFNALGMTKEEMERPLVGIVCSYNEIVPGHMNLDKIAQAVKLGVAMAGGTPVMFPAIAVCDGIAMGHIGMKYSLVTRDLIADSTECMATAHQFDALVMIPNCDKNVPGLLMAAARVNVPTVFVSGGPMLAGHVKGHKTSLSSMFEAVGSYAAGKMTEEDVNDFECHACPTCGSCSGMYTANSMNCLTEALGMGLPGNGTIPAVYSERLKLAKRAGYAVMEMYKKNICPRDIITKDAIMNALTVDMALGCSTNSMLHIPAIAHEIGFDFDISMANEISAKTPNLCHLAPAGPTYMEDLNEAGGVYAVINQLCEAGLINEDCMTVTGKTIGEAVKGHKNLNPEVIRPMANPYSSTGGLAVLKGNIAPDGSVVKRSAVVPEMLQHEGPARVFECEEDAIAAIKGGKIVEGDVVVIRYEGPKGGPGMRDICFLHIRHIRSSSLQSSVWLFRWLSGCRGWHRYILGWANLFRLRHLHAASTGRGNAYPDSSHTRQGYIRTFCAIRRILSSRICGNGVLLAVPLSAVSRNLLFPRALRRHLPGGSSRSRNRLRHQLPASLLFVPSNSGNRALAEKR